MRQVLVNLIGNAVKGYAAGRIDYRVAARREVGQAVWGEIGVTDTSPGIPEAERAAIFKPYYRSDGTADGLGLAISHGLVRQMGGDLVVESRMGAGSTFLLRLPLLQSPEALTS